MKKYFLHSVLLVLLAISFTGKVQSQSLNETLSVLSSDAAVKYSEPAITAFGSNMNSGWFSGLPSAANGLHVKLRFVAVGSLFTDDSRRFSSMGQFRFSSAQVDDILEYSGITRSTVTENSYNSIKNEILNENWYVQIQGPTIVGSNEEYLQVVFPGKDNITVEYPDGSTQTKSVESYKVSVEEVTGFLNELPLLPTPALQLDFSSVFGTGISFRYFPEIDIEDLGKINLWGIGLTHNIKYWLPAYFPVNIGAAFYFQKLDVGTIFHNTSAKFGLYVSKDFGSFISFSPYAGISYESSKTQIQYDYKFDTPVGTQDVNLSVDYSPSNMAAFTIGAAVDFPVVSLNVDFKFAKTKTASLGLGFGF